jgi:hypothetical protein
MMIVNNLLQKAIKGKATLIEFIKTSSEYKLGKIFTVSEY